MYKCKCGKEFPNSQSLNGHYGHCKCNLGEERFKEISEISKLRQRAATDARTLKLKNLSDERLHTWISGAHVCENCGKVMTERFASGRFCSRSCSNGFVSKNQSAEAKKAKSEKGRANLFPHPEVLRECEPRKWTDEDKKKHSEKMKAAHSNPSTILKMARLRGRKLSPETKKKISEKIKRYHAEGRIKGWNTRKIHSYAEDFWKTVLDNNGIEYEQEFKVTKSSIGVTGSGCYFLDFLLPGKIDLEIDGKQHYKDSQKEHDEERSRNLENVGYKVYRIKYRNPKNSLAVKEDVDNFLSWYRSAILNTMPTTNH